MPFIILGIFFLVFVALVAPLRVLAVAGVVAAIVAVWRNKKRLERHEDEKHSLLMRVDSKRSANYGKSGDGVIQEERIVKSCGHCYDGMGYTLCSFYVFDEATKIAQCRLFGRALKESSEALLICDKIYGANYEGGA